MKKNVLTIIPSMVFCLFLIASSTRAVEDKSAKSASDWTLNAQEYFEKSGLSVLVFHNYYPEGKQGGIEIIQHGERIAAVGDVRLESTPGQWGKLPTVGKRTVERSEQRVEVPLRFVKEEVEYRVRVEPCGDSICVTVDLVRPLPPELVGLAGFNLELYPTAYFAKSYHLGQTAGVFPRQSNGPLTLDMAGGVRPVPLAEGTKLIAAAEDPLCRLIIESQSGNLRLYDGRDTETNGWFVLRTPIPSGATAGAVRWKITPNAVPGWSRSPVIAHSQVGYHPQQEKRTVIELDPDTVSLGEATLMHIDPTKGVVPILSRPLTHWGRFLRFDYAVFDFTSVQEPGVYVIRYRDGQTLPFRIAADVYQKGVWQPTLETFFPVQMCHMHVVDRGRVWHGVCHLDDALQAPPNHDLSYIEGYQQGPTTDTPYSAYMHIPGLDRGGWHDAGDFDLAASSQTWATLMLALARESFGIDTDQTSIDPLRREVALHVPDGKPDILQQIAHGTQNLLGGYRAAGHSFAGITDASLEQYQTQGDASTMTDNRVFDPALGPDEIIGDRTGHRDDRLVFTSRDSGTEYRAAAALAAASRVLTGFENSLAKECLDTAIKVWDYEQTHPSVYQPSAGVPERPDEQEVLAAVELLLTTNEPRYAERLKVLLPYIEANVDKIGWASARALPAITDPEFTHRLSKAVARYAAELRGKLAQNPFGVPFEPQIWGVTWSIQNYAVQQYFLHKTYPNEFPRENILRVLDYVLGCHPASNTSLVSGVGAHSLMVAYGTNVNEWSHIPGGGVSGPSIIRPDFPELKEPFPFLWQQSEYVIGGASTYLFTVLAADQILNKGSESQAR
jgi:endoglucanase